ncbi:MAG: GvpL/GvpF family gas vesicle protein [Nitrospirota bacterium]
MEAKYIYGIIEASEEKLFNSCGFAAYEEVYTIPYQDISAVVSDSQFINYAILPKNQVARYLLRHQQVIEKIMDSHTIIPMKLGTYAFNIREVEEILSKGYQMLKDILAKINNKIEMDVVATWSDLNSIIKEIGKGEEIKALKEKIMSKPEGISMEDQIKIGNLVKNILDKEREKLTSEIWDVLGRVSIDSRSHGLMDDRMILNTAFLIDREKKAEFERRLNELNELFNERINFRCVGPLPPYSFYTVETKKISFEEKDWARKMLRLGNRATKEEVIKAYKNGAKFYHPDKNPGVSDTERRFNEINRAYRILLEYCLSAEQAGQEDACLFNEKEFGQNAIIVKIRE